LSLACRTPQVARLWRTGLTNGLSGRSLTFALSCNAIFGVHWLLVSNRAQLIGSLLIISQTGYIWLGLVRARKISVLLIFEPLTICIASYAIGKYLGGAILLAIACGLCIATQAASTRLVLRVSDASGVSLPAVTLATFTNLAWTTYALGLGDKILISAMVPVFVLSVIENVRVFVLHRRARQYEAERLEVEINNLMTIHQTLPYVAARTTYQSTSEVELYDWALDIA